MSTRAQKKAAKRNIKKAARLAEKSRSIAHSPKATRSALGKQGAAVAKRQRLGQDDPKTRAELYRQAQRLDIPGRSKMGRAELLHAVQRARHGTSD